MGLPGRHRFSGGFGVIESLVAMGVLGVAAMLLASVFKDVDVNTRKARLVSTMVALESSIISALEDKDNFQSRAAQFEAASRGGPVPVFELKSFDLVVAKQPSRGAPIFFDSEGKACAAGSSRCEISVEFDMKGSGGALQAAYRIALVGAAAQQVKTAALGGSFRDPIDYVLAVPSKNFRDPAKSGCAPGIARGMNKLTGEVLCWDVALPTERCAAGEIMRGFAADPSTGRMRPVCRKLRRASCNEHPYHVLQRLNARYLDPDVTPGASGGSCTPLMADEVPYRNDYRCPMGHAIYHLVSQSGPCRLNPAVKETGAVTYENF
jgi:hypothetical protein